MMFSKATRLGCICLSTILLAAGQHAHAAEAYESELSALAKTMIEPVARSGVGRVAVVDFVDLEGRVTQLGRFLAEELSNQLLREKEKGDLVVVERTRLGFLLKENHLSTTGLINGAQTQRLGEISGIQALFIGTLTPFGDHVKLSIKVLDTRTAETFAAATGSIPRVGTIDELLAKGIEGEEFPDDPPGSGQATAKSSHRQEHHRFAFEVRSCQLSGQSAECSLMIENRGKDRTLSLAGNSVMLDDFGNEYTPSRGAFANVSEEFNRLGSGTLRKDFAYDIATPVTLTFDGIFPQATAVDYLKLLLRVEGDTGWFPVTFRELPLQHQAVKSIQADAGPGGGILAGQPGSAAPPTGPTSIEGAVEQEVIGFAREATRRLSRSLLNAFKNKKKDGKDEPVEDGEEGGADPDGGG